MHGLCIKLLIVDGRAIDGAGEVDDDVSPAAGSVGQQVFMVASADEGSVAAHLLGCCSVRTADIDGRFLYDMLQKCLLAGSVLIEFVHVDERKPIEGELGIPFVAEIDAVGIICLHEDTNSNVHLKTSSNVQAYNAVKCTSDNDSNLQFQSGGFLVVNIEIIFV